MNLTDHTWLTEFDTWLTKLFAITAQDAGLSERDALLYSDLDPRSAALQFGEEYDLDRVDRVWR